MFFIPKWKPVPLPSLVSARSTEKQTILIISSMESKGIEDKLEASYSEDRIIQIKLGDQTRQHSENNWEVKTDDPLSMEGVISRLDGLDIIYFLGGIDVDENNTDDLRALYQSQERGVLTLFRLIKSLSKHGFTDRAIQIKVITNDVHRLGSHEITNPFSASLHGFTKSMAKEYPKLDIGCMDICLKDAASSALIDSIIAEPGDKLGQDVVIRNNERYVRTLACVRLPAVDTTRFRKGGVYFIIGGAGGIGLEVCRYLSETVQAKIVLIGRSELNIEQQEKIMGAFLRKRAVDGKKTFPNKNPSCFQEQSIPYGPFGIVVNSLIPEKRLMATC